MRKVLSVMILSVFAICCMEMSALQNQSDVLVTGDQQQASLVPNFKLDFDNINELSKNNALSEVSQKLVMSCLQIVRGLMNNKDITGTDEDLQSAQGYMAQLMTLKDRLKDTDSSDKINKVAELHETGKSEVDQNKKIVEQLPQANSLTKVIELPGLNKDTVERIKAYNSIIDSIAAVKNLPDVYEIPGMPSEFIEQSKKDAALLEQMKKIDSIKLLKEFPIVSPKLVEEITQLEQLPTYIKEHCETIDGILKIPDLPEKGVVSIRRLQEERNVLKEQTEKLTKELIDMSNKFQKAAQVTRNEYYFRMVVISILSRALFGYEFTSGDNFEELSKDYDHSVIAHSNSWLPSSGGVDKSSWKATASLLGGMLQLALSVDEISEHVPLLKRGVKRAESNLITSSDESSRFILDALHKLSGVLDKYKKGQDYLALGDFNDRKKIILEKMKRRSYVDKRKASDEDKKKASSGEKEAKDKKEVSNGSRKESDKKKQVNSKEGKIVTEKNEKVLPNKNKKNTVNSEKANNKNKKETPGEKKKEEAVN